MSGINFEFDPAVLKPLIEQVATELLAQLESDRAKLHGKIAYSEAEAGATTGTRAASAP